MVPPDQRPSLVRPTTVIYLSCGHAFRQLCLANDEGYATRSAKCDYCRNPISTFLSRSEDPSNPKRPELDHPDCKLVGRYIIKRVDKGRDHGLLMHLTREFVNYYGRQARLFFGDGGSFSIIPE